MRSAIILTGLSALVAAQSSSSQDAAAIASEALASQNSAYSAAYSSAVAQASGNMVTTLTPEQQSSINSVALSQATAAQVRFLQRVQTRCLWNVIC